MSIKPIKRNEALKPLSREHHYGLLLCWKIRTGLKNEVAPSRIKRYVDWFYQGHIKPHFDLEETHIYTILGNENDHIKTALKHHELLRTLFAAEESVTTLTELANALESHIRYEERVLFNEIQKVATSSQFEVLTEVHFDAKFQDNLEDIFWE